MAIYAVGDIQGCVEALRRLVNEIQFDPINDTLWFTGDLVNRGPYSLEVLRFIKALDTRQVSVLGNHDLHLLALAYGVSSARPGDTVEDVLTASDRIELIEWLRHRPLLYSAVLPNPMQGTPYVLVHAGLAPQWTLAQAQVLAREVEMVLQGDTPQVFLAQLYGNVPGRWEDSLVGMERLRCITNYLTRMRYCYPDGRLAWQYDGHPQHAPPEMIPWFEVQSCAWRDEMPKLHILFGHWSALMGETSVSRLYALDTGCVWGIA